MAGWKKYPLATICEKVSVGHVGTTSPFYRNDGIPFLRTQNVGADGLLLDDLVFITPDFHASLKKSQLQSGDLLLTRVVTDSLKCGIVPPSLGEANCANVILIRPKPELLAKFLQYLITAPVSQAYLLDKRVGSAQQVVNTAILKDWAIPLPSLDGQKRIIAVLDEAFEGLSRARANAEANLADARELYSNALEQALLESGAPFSDLGNHVDQLVGYAFKSADFTDNPADIRLLRGDNIVPGGIRWEGTKHWRADRVNGFERYFLQPDDVLIAMDRTWIKAGIKFAVVSEQDTPSLLVQRVARLRARPTILVDFLAALIRSRDFERYVLSIQTGTGVPHISGGQINAFPVRVPAIETQTKIMERLNAIQTAAVEIAANIQSSATELQTLRQSLLQKAFSGELT